MKDIAQYNGACSSIRRPAPCHAKKIGSPGMEGCDILSTKLISAAQSAVISMLRIVSTNLKGFCRHRDKPKVLWT